MTALELQKQLQTDPDYIARKRKQELKSAEIIARSRAEEAPLIAELQRVGIHIRDVSDLVNSSTPYPRAIPILLKHLLRPYSDGTREFIARALAVPDARGAWSTLLAEYRKAAPRSRGRMGAKKGLAVALAATATDSVMPELVDLTRDRSQGPSRVLLLPALRKSRLAIAKQALEDLASDPDLAVQIASYKRRKR